MPAPEVCERRRWNFFLYLRKTLRAYFRENALTIAEPDGTGLQPPRDLGQAGAPLVGPCASRVRRERRLRQTASRSWGAYVRHDNRLGALSADSPRVDQGRKREVIMPSYDLAWNVAIVAASKTP